MVGGSLFMCGKDLMTRFILLGVTVKHVEACLSARDDRQVSFHHFGGPVRLVQAYLCAGNPDNAVLTSEEVLLSTWRPVTCQR